MEENLRAGYVNLALFWSKVEKTNACWLWTGCQRVMPNGARYGYISIRVDSVRGLAHRNEPAHRVSFELAKGPIPDGLSVLHSCDNGLCVNPAHLRAGTEADNAADRLARNRQPHAITEEQVAQMRTRYASDITATVGQLAKQYGVYTTTASRIIQGLARRSSPGPITPLRPADVGSRHRLAKLTEAQVVEIRHRYDAGATLRTLAEEFGVNRSGIGKIVRGAMWKHVPVICQRVEPAKLALSDSTIKRIRARCAAGATQADLMRAFNRDRATISMLVRGLTHPTPPPTPPRVC